MQIYPLGIYGTQESEVYDAVRGDALDGIVWSHDIHRATVQTVTLLMLDLRSTERNNDAPI